MPTIICRHSNIYPGVFCCRKHVSRNRPAQVRHSSTRNWPFQPIRTTVAGLLVLQDRFFFFVWVIFFVRIFFFWAFFFFLHLSFSAFFFFLMIVFQNFFFWSGSNLGIFIFSAFFFFTAALCAFSWSRSGTVVLLLLCFYIRQKKSASSLLLQKNVLYLEH